MAITTVTIVKNGCRETRWYVQAVIYLPTFLLCSFAAAQQQTMQQTEKPSHGFIPTIDVVSHAYQIKNPSFDGSDDGAALEITPGLAWYYYGPQLLTQIDVNHQKVWYKDDQRSSFSLNEYSFNNQLRGFDNRLVWTLGASRGHIVRGNGVGGAVFRDKITNVGGLSQTDRYDTELLLTTARHKPVQYALNLAAGKVKSDQPEQDDLLGNIDNERLRASVTTSRDYRYGGIYWRAAADASRTERAERNKLVQDKAQLQLGLPLFAGIGIVVKGNYEKNSIRDSDFTNDFSSVGTGLEWHFGKASRINVTYNNVIKGRDQSNYLATDFLLAPSRRTSLSGFWDKRYFGHTAQLAGQYNLKFLSLRLSYNDNISTRSFLETELNDLGLFVCPGSTTDIGDCVTLPRADYQPLPGQQILQFSEFDTSIQDDVILTRQGTLGIGYKRNRYAGSLQLLSSELRYEETERVDRRHSLSIQNSFRLTTNSSVSMNIKALDYTVGSTGREDRNLAYELAWNRTLSSSAELSVTARHNRRNSSDSEFEYQENRLSVSYQYQF